MNSDLKFAIFKITENDCQDWGMYYQPHPSSLQELRSTMKLLVMTTI